MFWWLIIIFPLRPKQEGISEISVLFFFFGHINSFENLWSKIYNFSLYRFLILSHCNSPISLCYVAPNKSSIHVINTTCYCWKYTHILNVNLARWFWPRNLLTINSFFYFFKMPWNISANNFLNFLLYSFLPFSFPLFPSFSFMCDL